jgi:hypothetical protein
LSALFAKKSVIEVDDFTKRLWKIYETVNSEGIKQVGFCFLTISKLFKNFNHCFALMACIWIMHCPYKDRNEF